MITLRIEVDAAGMDRINQRFGSLANALHAPMQESLESLRSYMADNYPPPYHGGAHFVSDRQRRYVMWAIRNGVIQVPYVRTGKLGQSWTYEIHSTGNGIRGAVGPGISYARWVQSSQHQARIHQGRWITDVQAENAKRAEIVQRFRNAIQRAIG